MIVPVVAARSAGIKQPTTLCRGKDYAPAWLHALALVVSAGRYLSHYDNATHPNR